MIAIATFARMTQEEAFELFDTLDPVNPDELVGIWRGDEIATGHPMDGLLGAMGWFGKEFRGKDEVYPLLMADSHGETFSINPG